jgi:hypothetical protein
MGKPTPKGERKTPECGKTRTEVRGNPQRPQHKAAPTSKGYEGVFKAAALREGAARLLLANEERPGTAT